MPNAPLDYASLPIARAALSPRERVGRVIAMTSLALPFTAFTLGIVGGLAAQGPGSWFAMLWTAMLDGSVALGVIALCGIA